MLPNKILGALPRQTIHVCVDMQRLFAPGGPWPTPWLARTLPNVVRICGAFRDRTVFTRFLPPAAAEEAPGSWRRYYERWRNVTLENLSADLPRIVPELEEQASASAVFDKHVYSAFGAPGFAEHLRERGAEALVVTGTETDVCILATVLDAVDLGYRIMVARDAVCSSSDESHDALLGLFARRFSEQIEVADTASILRLYPD